MRIVLEHEPFTDPSKGHWGSRGRWPAKWVSAGGEIPLVAAYRLAVSFDAPTTVRVHVTADERYVLFVNGIQLGRGPERGDLQHWFFESYDIAFPAGESTLVAQTFALGERMSPFAQFGAEPGFLLCPDDESLAPKLATGDAPWEAKLLGGYRMLDPLCAWGTGWKTELLGAEADWGWQHGSGDGWKPVSAGRKGMNRKANDENPVHRLIPASLPAMLEQSWSKGKVRHVARAEGVTATTPIPIRAAESLGDEVPKWQALLAGTDLEIPPHTARRVILDLEDYVCGYPRLLCSGGKGSSVRIHWQEALFEGLDNPAKGNRDEIEGKFFTTLWHKKDGVGDVFRPDGGAARVFEPLWWEAGRYVEVLVNTADEPLTLLELRINETHYPMELESRFSASDDRLEKIVPIMFRTLQMCSHETYMDCPYYEQLMYIGDTRLEMLATYCATRDDALPRKALRMFEASRVPEGLTQSRYPTRVLQRIPTFSMWYIATLHDFAMWRGDLDFLKELMPGARIVLDRYDSYRNADDLIEAPNGWNFMDWVHEWPNGIPPGGDTGVSGLMNLQYVLVRKSAALLEELMGEPELAERNRKIAEAVERAVRERFWVSDKGYADDLEHTGWSEHSQALAILSGVATDEQRSVCVRRLLQPEGLAKASIYFSHYVFEALRETAQIDELLRRLEYWYDHITNGLKTTIEHPEPSRSDCHAWGAHPYYHYFASLAGVRPTKPGFAEVEVRPQPGSLTAFEAVMPSPRGMIVVKLADGQVSVNLPEGVSGKLVWQGREEAIS
jgi:hypothetical protein